MQIEREVKENALHAIENQRKVGVTILKSGKIGFKTKYVKRDEERHCIMIKGLFKEDNITIINIYTPNILAPQCIRQMLRTIKGGN